MEEKTAKEMFEKLGYELIDLSDKDIKWFRYIARSERKDYWLIFDFFMKTISVFRVQSKLDIDDENKRFYKQIFKSEFKAIQKQIEELGW